MKLQLDLSTSEVNTILDALTREHTNTLKRKSWRPSARTNHRTEVSRIRDKLVSAELIAKREMSRDVDAD